MLIKFNMKWGLRLPSALVKPGIYGHEATLKETSYIITRWANFGFYNFLFIH